VLLSAVDYVVPILPLYLFSTSPFSYGQSGGVISSVPYDLQHFRNSTLTHGRPHSVVDSLGHLLPLRGFRPAFTRLDNLVHRKIRVRALLALLGAKLIGLSWDLPSLLYNTHRTTQERKLICMYRAFRFLKTNYRTVFLLF